MTFTEDKQFDIDFEAYRHAANRKLVRTIQVEIQGIRPKGNKSDQAYTDKLRKLCEVRMGAKFIEWNPASQVWRFEIDGERMRNK